MLILCLGVNEYRSAMFNIFRFGSLLYVWCDDHRSLFSYPALYLLPTYMAYGTHMRYIPHALVHRVVKLSRRCHIAFNTLKSHEGQGNILPLVSLVLSCLVDLCLRLPGLRLYINIYIPLM